MKSCFFILIVIFSFSSSSSAQIENKSFLITANFRYDVDESKYHGGTSNNVIIDHEKLTLIQFEPQFGYFIKDNFLIGIGFGYISRIEDDFHKDDIIPNYRTERTSKSIRPFLKYYKMVHDKFGLWSSLDICFGLSKYDIRDYRHSWEGKFWDTSLESGILYFVTDKLGLEAKIGWLTYARSTDEEIKQKTLPKDTSRSFIFSFDMASIVFGVNYFFRNKQ